MPVEGDLQFLNGRLSKTVRHRGVGHDVDHAIPVKLLRGLHQFVGESTAIIRDDDEGMAENREYMRD
jgi:hypothetical protein